MRVVREDDRDEDAAAAAAAANTGGAGGAAGYLLATGGGDGSAEAGASVGAEIADAATDLLASSGDKAGATTQLLASTGDKAAAGLAEAVRLPWFRALWNRVVSALGAKGVLPGVVGATVVVAVLSVGAAVVVLDPGADSDDDVETSGPGGGDEGEEGDEGDEGDVDHQAGGGDKPDPMTATTAPAGSTTTTAAADEDDEVSAPGAPDDTRPDTDVTTPTTASSTTAPTTTQPQAPAPSIQRFVVNFDNSRTVSCTGNDFAMLFRWSSQNATSATLAPVDGRTSLRNLEASGSRVTCARMQENWRLTVAGPGGSVDKLVLTPYLG